MDRTDDIDHVEIASAASLWDWLGENGGQEAGVWLVTWKAAHPDRYVSRDEVLDALIAHGWIDGRRMKLDADRTMQLISPRRQQAWAQTYKDRAARLEDEGRMTARGRDAIAASKAAGLWDAMADVDALEVPTDLAFALSDRGATAFWDAFAPSYRRNVLRWIASARTTPTRLKRIKTVADHAARAEKVPQF